MGHMKKLASVCAAAFALTACGAGTDDDTSSATNSSSNSTNSAAAQEAAVKLCQAQKYTGTETDPQVYTYDYIAQFDRCALAATGNNNYKIDGDRQCKVLDALLKATASKFKPLHCNGEVLRP